MFLSVFKKKTSFFFLHDNNQKKHGANKAQRKKEITDGDQVMSEICMGYLYLLHKANEEGILESGESIGELINIKIH